MLLLLLLLLMLAARAPSSVTLSSLILRDVSAGMLRGDRGNPTAPRNVFYELVRTCSAWTPGPAVAPRLPR